MSPALNLALFVLLGAAVVLLVAMRRRRLRPGRRRSSDRRATLEDAMKFAWHEEDEGRHATLAGLAGALALRDDAAVALIENMQSAGLVKLVADRIELTSTGRQHAVQVIRAHRLWERYLADETGVAPERWHLEAERREHAMSPDDVDELARRLGNPVFDPHGDPIPAADGRVPRPATVALTTLATGRSARVTHVEDEPPVVYAQLAAEGIHPGMMIRVRAASGRRIILEAEGRRFALAPIVARNVSVTPLAPDEDGQDAGVATLANLSANEEAEVVRVAPSCRGLMRRRIMDLGIVPGTKIAFVREAPTGGLRAYRVRGTTVALRDEQSRAIAVRGIVAGDFPGGHKESSGIDAIANEEENA